MGCGSEISDWDDKAVQDSLAGKNTELNPKILEEAKEHHEMRVNLEDKTAKFEKSGIVQNRDMVRTITHVPLARGVAKELGIAGIVFQKNLADEYGNPERGNAMRLPEGVVIQIGSAYNATKVEFQRTLLHEIGERYYVDKMSSGQQQQWGKWREQAMEKGVLNKVEEQTTDKMGHDVRAQHHFAERFTEYCLERLYGRTEEIDTLRGDFPDQMKALDELRDR